MKELMTLDFETQPVRLHLDEAGMPWWSLADVGRCLELGNTRDAKKGLEPDEWRTVALSDGSPGPDHIFVNEQGVYRLVMRSRKPVAKRLQRWVFHEVLPEIRRTGRYNGAQERVLPSGYGVLGAGEAGRRACLHRTDRQILDLVQGLSENGHEFQPDNYVYVIAGLAGVTAPTVRRALALCVHLGLLEIEPRD